MNIESPPSLDPLAAARWLHLPRAESAWLHEEVARRMLPRLDWIRREPRHWLHWEPALGGWQAHAALLERHARAPCFVVEQDRPARLVPGMDRTTAPWWHPRRWVSATDGVPAQAPPPDGVDMVWANMGLHMAADPATLMRRWHAALAVDGFLMFSCLGPDSLRELRALYRARGWPAPAHEFTDMHDWGDMLLHAGFAEPVMDVERIELTFATPERLLRELRELGRNLHRQRHAGLRGRGWREALLRGLREQAADAGDVRLTFEVVYGHAFKPPARNVDPGRTTIALADVRASLRQIKQGTDKGN